MIRKSAPEDLTDLPEVGYRKSQIAHSFLSRDFFDQERGNLIRKYQPVAATCHHPTVSS